VTELATCTAPRAHQLLDTIRSALSLARDAIIEAYETRAWIALGYESWHAMCDAELGMRVQLPRPERRELVGELRGVGMSSRAIGDVLGISRDTALKDSAVRNLTPDRVVGLDGKSYPDRLPRTAEDIAAAHDDLTRRHAITRDLFTYLEAERTRPGWRIGAVAGVVRDAYVKIRDGAIYDQDQPPIDPASAQAALLQIDLCRGELTDIERTVRRYASASADVDTAKGGQDPATLRGADRENTRSDQHTNP
jgi:hypothetical protein